MKTSNKLILSLLIVTFLAILASSMVLKSEFEKIDRDDPFYGFTQQSLEPFHAVKISGNYPHLVQLLPGEQSALLSRQDTQLKLEWEVSHDTLHLNIQYPETNRRYNQSYAFYDTYAGINITSPKLTALMVEGVTCRLTGWNETQMRINIRGHQQGIQLKESNFSQFSATIHQGGLLLLEKDTNIENAKVMVQDSSSFFAEYATIDSLDMQFDEAAQLKLPGYLLKKLAL